MSRVIALLEIGQNKLVTNWQENLVNATFGLTMFGLALLLALLYAGVPIVGS